MKRQSVYSKFNQNGQRQSLLTQTRTGPSLHTLTVSVCLSHFSFDHSHNYFLISVTPAQFKAPISGIYLKEMKREKGREERNRKMRQADREGRRQRGEEGRKTSPCTYQRRAPESRLWKGGAAMCRLPASMVEMLPLQPISSYWQFLKVGLENVTESALSSYKGGGFSPTQ